MVIHCEVTQEDIELVGSVGSSMYAMFQVVYCYSHLRILYWLVR